LHELRNDNVRHWGTMPCSQAVKTKIGIIQEVTLLPMSGSQLSGLAVFGSSTVPSPQRHRLLPLAELFIEESRYLSN